MSYDWVAPDSMSAAAGYIDREYGPTGYRLKVEDADFGGGASYLVRAADGAEFRIRADRWGNVIDLCDTAHCLERPSKDDGLSRHCPKHAATPDVQPQHAHARITA